MTDLVYLSPPMKQEVRMVLSQVSLSKEQETFPRMQWMWTLLWHSLVLSYSASDRVSVGIGKLHPTP